MGNRIPTTHNIIRYDDRKSVPVLQRNNNYHYGRL